MTTVITTKHLYNRAEYGKVEPGTVLVLRDELARALLRAGSVTLMPERTYETKVIRAAETKQPEATQAAPFRVMHLPDPEPPALAELRRQVLADAAVEQSRTPDSGRRKRGRPRRTA